MKLIPIIAALLLATPAMSGPWQEIKAFKGKKVPVMSDNVEYIIKERSRKPDPTQQQILIRIGMGRKNKGILVEDIKKWPDSTFEAAGVVYIKSKGCTPKKDIHHIQSKFYTLSYSC